MTTGNHVAVACRLSSTTQHARIRHCRKEAQHDGYGCLYRLRTSHLYPEGGEVTFNASVTRLRSFTTVHLSEINSIRRRSSKGTFREISKAAVWRSNKPKTSRLSAEDDRHKSEVVCPPARSTRVPYSTQAAEACKDPERKKFGFHVGATSENVTAAIIGRVVRNDDGREVTMGETWDDATRAVRKLRADPRAPYRLVPPQTPLPSPPKHAGGACDARATR